jgi:hypothetical protein
MNFNSTANYFVRQAIQILFCQHTLCTYVVYNKFKKLTT